MTLIANRRFAYYDRSYNKGDVIDPEPDPVTRAKWERTGFAVSGEALNTRVSGLGCPDCGFVGVARRALTAHRASAHPVNEPVVSAHSPGALPPPEPVEPSLAGSGEFACPDCDRSFKGAQPLKVHRSRVHAGA